MASIDKIRRFLEKLFERMTPFQIALLVFVILFGATCAVRLWASGAKRTVFEVEYAASREFKKSIKKESKKAYGPNLVDPAILYSDRLREASAIAIALSLGILDERIKNNRLMIDLEQIFFAAEARNLLPPLVRVNRETRNIESDFGSYYFNYRAFPFCLEIISVGRFGKQSGETFVLRIPDETGSAQKGGDTNQAAYATVWTAPDAWDSGPAPRPFAQGADYARAGWRQETLRTADVTPEKLAELSNSLKLTMSINPAK